MIIQSRDRSSNKSTKKKQRKEKRPIVDTKEKESEGYDQYVLRGGRRERPAAEIDSMEFDDTASPPSCYHN